MRKPNGFGSVYKMSGNRRKPYAVVITKGFVLEDGRAVQKRSYLGYYSSQKEAEIALANYNQNPYDTNVSFEDVYQKWSEQKYNELSGNTIKGYTNAFKRFHRLHKKTFVSLHTSDLENEILMCDTSEKNKSLMKTLLNQMYKYALKYDIVQNNLAERFSVAAPNAKIDRVPFSDKEISQLWESSDDIAKVVLVLIYTGVRCAELYTMEIDTKEWLLKGGLKTESGRDRIVPIRKKIRPLMKTVEKIRAGISKDRFYRLILNRVDPHKPHDCRVTFSTRYKGTNDTMRKLIMGHKIEDLTERVYTKYSVAELREYIESVDF